MDVRLILVLVLGRQTVYGQNTVYLCLSKYIVFENTHTHIATAASETEGVAAVSRMESHMNRRPLGSIDPNSIRETELHTESRRRHNRGERESTLRPRPHRERDAARQRTAATRRRETDEARAERLRANRQRKAARRFEVNDNVVNVIYEVRIIFVVGNGVMIYFEVCGKVTDAICNSDADVLYYHTVAGSIGTCFVRS